MNPWLLLATSCLIAVLWLWFTRTPRAPRPEPGPSRAPSRADPGAAPGEPVAVVDVVPGELQVRVFAHVLASAPGLVRVWTYVSEGLLALGQKEIVLSVERGRHARDDAFPAEPFDYYRTVHRLAGQGRLVHEGEYSALDPAKPGILRDDLHGVLFTHPQRFPGVPVPGPHLTAILVTGPELEVAIRFGHLRLTALLGRRYRFYPTAPWVDLRRDEITTPSAMARSMLADIPPSHLRGASVCLEPAPGFERAPIHPRSKVVLRLRPEAARQLLAAVERLGPETGYVLSVDLDPEADACLVWSPGQTDLSVIGLDGTKCARISGNFVAIAPGVAKDAVRCQEDGFGVTLTKESWAAIWAGLAARRRVEIPGAGEEMGFVVTCVDDEAGAGVGRAPG